MKAKTKFTRLWSILLALVMVVGMLPTVALAEEPATATADFSADPTTALTLLNSAKTSGAADNVWDSTTNTLTLNGVNFETTAATAVKLPDGSTIVLNGDNIITSGEATSKDSFGIYALGDLTINGDGKLTVTSGTANDDSHGIYACDKMSITGNVIATSGTANDRCYGIHAGDSIAISGNVTAIGGGAGEYSYGICAKEYDDENISVNISGGTVTATGGTATNGDSYGIYASGHGEDYIGVKISGDAHVTATGGTATNGDSYGINAYHKVNIAGGTVNANGGTATNNSYGIYADDDVNIAGGTLIAKVTSGNGTANALNKAPKTLPDTYWWRTSNSGAYHKYPASAYIWDAAHTYFEIQKPGYTVTFDANGGSGEMAGADVVSGEYTLPANGFTAPEGKQFKCWSVDGSEKAVGDKITVSADTTVKAVWENIPAAPIEYEILDGANSSWTQDSDRNLSVRGSGAFSEFVGVKVDGKSVDEKYYTVKEGSTIVTLKADYLNTLTVGSHTLEIVWTDGSASTIFTIEAESPQTGDNSMMALWIAVLFVSGFGVVATAVYGKKRKSVK